MEEIKAETKTKIDATAGNLSISATANSEGGLVGEVSIAIGGRGRFFLETPPEHIERAALLLEKIRRSLYDLRHVCITHGYHEGYDCQLCKPPEIEATPKTPTPAVDDPAF